MADQQSLQMAPFANVAPVNSMMTIVGSRPEGKKTLFEPSRDGAVQTRLFVQLNKSGSIHQLGRSNWESQSSLGIGQTEKMQPYAEQAPMTSLLRLGNFPEKRKQDGLVLDNYIHVVDEYYRDNTGYFVLREQVHKFVGFTNFTVSIRDKSYRINACGEKTEMIDVEVYQAGKTKTISVETQEFQFLVKVIEKEFPECVVFTDHVRNGKEILRHIFAHLLTVGHFSHRTFYTYFG